MMSTKPGEGTRYWKQQVKMKREASSLKPTVVSGRTLRNGKCSSVNVQVTVQFLKLNNVCVLNAVQTVWTTFSVSENCGEQDLLQHVSVVIGSKRSTNLVHVNGTTLRVKEHRNILNEISKRKANRIGHILRSSCLLQRFIEGNIKGRVEVTGRRWRRRRKLLNDLTERRGYSHLKEEALDRSMWRAGFGRGFGLVVRQTAKWIIKEYWWF